MTLYAAPNCRHLDNIRKLLATTCPDKTKCGQAFEAINEAIELYRQTYPLRDASVLERSGISTSRKELSAILKQLEKLKQQLAALSPETISILGHVNEMGVGQTKQLLENFNSAIVAAKKFADGQPDKEVDVHRTVFACAVAKALQDAGIKVSATTPSEAITGTRNGAMYGKILQEACCAAGLGSVSLGSLIHKSLGLMPNLHGDEVGQ